MKYLPHIILITVYLLPFNFQSQQVTTLASITANGGVTLDEDGNIFVAHFGPLPINPVEAGKNIYKVTPSGEVSLFVEDELNVGSGNHFDSQGFLYQSNYQGNVIFKINGLGEIVDPSFASINGPVGITVIENDTLVVCECNISQVKKIAQDGTITTYASGNLFNCANGITQDEAGNFYTTNFSDGRITKIAISGNVSTLGTLPGGSGHLTYRSNDQSLYIASYGEHQIFKMDLDGNWSLFAGDGSAGAVDSLNPLEASFNKPNGIEISHDGCSLYITQDDDVLREIKFDDGECAVGITPIDDRLDIEIYPNPASDYITFSNNSQINFDSLDLLSMEGKLLKTVNASKNFSLDLRDYSPGIYFLKFVDKEGYSYSKKITVE